VDRDSAAAATPQIVTFYSYKGGTGRSMALANVAWILATSGKRVLTIDWDLEAPGLHRYFHPFLHDTELLSSDGVIDFVMDYALAAVTTKRGARKDWYKAHANMLRCATSLNWQFGKGTLDFIPAGRLGPDYATRVNSFDWQDFYERLDGGLFLEAAKHSFRDYDYVLIDSRTGVSDTSGICTVQMPDVLVVCFTLNSQSIEGVGAVADSADAQRRNAKGERTLRIFPVPMRVERAEQRRLELGRRAAIDRLSPLLWHLDEQARASYWERIDVAYQPFYAYEEVLATFADPPGTKGTLLAAFETLTEYTTGHAFRMPDMPLTARSEALGRFARGQDPQTLHLRTSPPGLIPRPADPLSQPAERVRRSAEPAAPPDTRPGPPGGYAFYVSFASLDLDKYMERLIEDLSREVQLLLGQERAPVAFFDREPISPRDSWPGKVRDALGTAKTAICILSRAYTNSQFCGREFSVLSQRAQVRSHSEPSHVRPAILPIVWLPLPSSLPEPLRNIQLRSDELPDIYFVEGLRYLISLRGHRDEYNRIVKMFSHRLVDAMEHSPLARMKDVPELSDVANPFEVRRSEAPVADSLGTGPDVAVLTVVSSTPAWTPFSTSIGALASEVATRLMMTLRESPFDTSTFDSLLAAASRNRTPLVMVVDGRALALPALKNMEWAITTQVLRHVVLIVAGDRSPSEETARQAARFLTAPLALAHAQEVADEAALRTALEIGLSKARANIIVQQTVPQSPIAGTSRPQISRESM
jgi:MinD-like ATPase involved in chromosome partitioning or flagellar assembly